MLAESALRQGARARAAARRSRAGDTAAFGELMHEHWEHKKRRSGGMSNPQIDEWYELGRRNGAIGGKLVGAGGGGFLMFYAEDHRRLRAAMTQGRPRRSALPLRLRGHQGAVRVSLPVAILAGGLATRLRPRHRADPEVARRRRRPAVRRAPARAGSARQGVTRVVFCVGASAANMVQRGARRRRALGHAVRLRRSTATLLGTGGALRRALPVLGDAFFVLYGDSYLRLRSRAVERAFRRERTRRADDGLPQRRPVGPQQRAVRGRPHRFATTSDTGRRTCTTSTTASAS